MQAAARPAASGVWQAAVDLSRAGQAVTSPACGIRCAGNRPRSLGALYGIPPRRGGISRATGCIGPLGTAKRPFGSRADGVGPVPDGRSARKRTRHLGRLRRPRRYSGGSLGRGRPVAEAALRANDREGRSGRSRSESRRETCSPPLPRLAGSLATARPRPARTRPTRTPRSGHITRAQRVADALGNTTSATSTVLIDTVRPIISSVRQSHPTLA